MLSLVAALACRLPDREGPQASGRDSEDVETETEPDADGDGFDRPFDCDDTDATVHPYAPEVCGNGHEDNCLLGPDGCDWSGPQPLRGLELSSDDPNGAAGESLALCDANGDGELDIVMGDRNANGVTGSVFVFYGPVLESRNVDDADYTLVGSAPFAAAGFAIDCRSDFDRDGAADILVAEVDNTGTGANGGAYLVAGGRTGTGELDDEATSTWWAESATDIWYSPIAFDGDQDGPDEIAVSVWTDFGATYVVADVSPGTYDLDKVASAYVYGTGLHDQLSGVRGNVGDLDGDGDDELAVGGHGLEGGSTLYVFETWLTGALTSADADVRVTDDTDGFGSGTDHADLDDDGHDDLLVGNPYQGGHQGGAAYVFYGPVDHDVATTSAPVRISDSHENTALGSSFAAPEDGTNGLLIGASLGDDERILYLFDGGLEGVYSVADARASWDTDAARWAGIDIATGEVTGDGVIDFVIGGGADAEGAGVLIMPSFDL